MIAVGHFVAGGAFGLLHSVPGEGEGYNVGKHVSGISQQRDGIGKNPADYLGCQYEKAEKYAEAQLAADFHSMIMIMCHTSYPFAVKFLELKQASDITPVKNLTHHNTRVKIFCPIRLITGAYFCNRAVILLPCIRNG
jgi:hypothetical protein